MNRALRPLFWALLCLCLAWPTLTATLATAALWVADYAAAHTAATLTTTALILAVRALALAASTPPKHHRHAYAQ